MKLPSVDMIDKRSDDLFKEFCEHKEEFINNFPDKTNEFKIFLGWSIQKLSSLQLLAEILFNQIDSNKHTVDSQIDEKDKTRYEELAKNLMAAAGAEKLNIGIDHYKRTYLENSEISDYWYNLAKNVDEITSSS